MGESIRESPLEQPWMELWHGWISWMQELYVIQSFYASLLGNESWIFNGLGITLWHESPMGLRSLAVCWNRLGDVRSLGMEFVEQSMVQQLGHEFLLGVEQWLEQWMEWLEPWRIWHLGFSHPRT
jgi:hypothetical protein